MQSEGAAGDSSGAVPSTQHALRNWLESTLAEPKTGLTDREWQVLTEVVAAMPIEGGTSSENLASCAEQLVSAFLQIRFPGVDAEDGMRQRMSARIAQSLCADPTARRRLAEFQQILQRPQS